MREHEVEARHGRRRWHPWPWALGAVLFSGYAVSVLVGSHTRRTTFDGGAMLVGGLGVLAASLWELRRSRRQN